jgi:hypothetical protein
MMVQADRPTTLARAGVVLALAVAGGVVAANAWSAIDGEQTARAVANRLRDQTDMATVTRDLSRTASAAVAPRSLAIWLRRRGANR